MSAFREVVADAQALRALVGWPSVRALQKERLTLDEHCRAFIAHSPYVLMATSSADGRCDVSPKGDAPGREETLRVNGRAVLTRDAELLRASALAGEQPLLAIGVEVEHCYLHCGKA